MKDDGAAVPILHSYVSAGLAAHVMYGKFINALPCYRQEKDFGNQFGVKIGRGTMAHWTIYCSENYFSPMIGYLQRWEIEENFRIMKSDFEARPVYVQRDDRIKAHLKCDKRLDFPSVAFIF